jgi:hypothetical protein
MQCSVPSLNEQKIEKDETDQWGSFEKLILKSVFDDEADHSTHVSLEITPGSSSSSSGKSSLSQIDFEEGKTLGPSPSNTILVCQPTWSSCLNLIQLPGHDSTKTSCESSRREESSSSQTSCSSGCSNLEDLSQVCPFFLKGKCRHKGNCKMSHQLSTCPYCKQDMPSGKLASSTHLCRCWKKHCVQ